MKKLVLLFCMILSATASHAATCETTLMPAFTAAQAVAICGKYGTSVAISQLPASDNTIDLGSASKSWRSAYIDTSLVFGTGANSQLAAYVPTLAATPVAETNLYKPGLNIIPTNAANNAGFLGAATPVVGQQFRIVNASGAAQRIKASGGATLNGATAGGYISIASLATVDCITAENGNQVCLQPVIPTPAGP